MGFAVAALGVVGQGSHAESAIFRHCWWWVHSKLPGFVCADGALCPVFWWSRKSELWPFLDEFQVENVDPTWTMQATNAVSTYHQILPPYLSGQRAMYEDWYWVLIREYCSAGSLHKPLAMKADDYKQSDHSINHAFSLVAGVQQAIQGRALMYNISSHYAQAVFDSRESTFRAGSMRLPAWLGSQSPGPPSSWSHITVRSDPVATTP